MTLTQKTCSNDFSRLSSKILPVCRKTLGQGGGGSFPYMASVKTC